MPRHLPRRRAPRPPLSVAVAVAVFVLAVYGCTVLAIATSVLAHDWSRGMGFVGAAVISGVVALGMWRRSRDAHGSAVVLAAALVVTAVWGESWQLGRAVVGVALLVLLLAPPGQRRWFARDGKDGVEARRYARERASG